MQIPDGLRECEWCSGDGFDEHGNACWFCDGDGVLPNQQERNLKSIEEERISKLYKKQHFKLK